MAENKAADIRKSKSHEDNSLWSMSLKTTEHFIRFAGLSNAGGVIATIPIIGATAKDGVVLSILALPLALFSFGVICALLSTAFIFVAAQRNVIPIERHVFLHKSLFRIMDRYSDPCSICMVLFFILGCISGVAIVALAPGSVPVEVISG